MPDPSTTRLSLYKSKSDGSELLSYTQDIGQNWDRVDAAVGFASCTSSTRPSAPYSGKSIMETDTSYRTYFSNGTTPASASWVEIPNSSATYNSHLKLALGKQINIGASGSTAAIATVTSGATDILFAARTPTDTSGNSHWYMQTDGTMNWGAGGASSTDTALARTAAGRLALTGTNAALTIGSASYRNALGPTSVTTVANTITETVVATGTIPAADVVAGAVYRVKAWGIASVTGTPTFTLTARLGGVAGASMGAIGPTTASTGVANKAWTAEVELICVTTGASGTWMPRFALFQNISVATVIGSNHQIQQTAAVTRDTTVSNTMVVTWTWGTASSSNTATCQGYIFERVA